MGVRRLIWCSVCGYPVRWAEAVAAAGGWCHERCADEYWADLARVLG